MFSAEHLQEKWAPLLNAEGVDEIKDPHRRAVTAFLWGSEILSTPSASRRGAHFSCRCSALNICFYLFKVIV